MATTTEKLLAPKPTLFEEWNNGNIGNFGSFQTTIFQAYRLADNTNRSILNEAFPYWFTSKSKTVK